MIYSHRWAKGSSLARVLLQALVLTALVSVLLLFASPHSAFAQSVPKADYRFQNTRSSSIGSAPALKDIGPKSNTFTNATVDGAPRKVLSFPKGNGVKLSPTTGVVSSGTYTIVMLFELNNVGSDVSRFRRIIDFKNGASDNGLYIENVAGTSKLSFYRGSTQGAVQGSTPIAANQYVQVVLTREAGGTVVGYVDGVQQLSFTDTAGDAVIADNTLRFFIDNQGGIEHSAGSVARIRLYDNIALSATEVGTLDRIEPTVFTVNSTADGTDNLLQDGKCSTSVPQQCTLRAAIQQSNHTLGNDTINFAPGLSGTIDLTQGVLLISNEPDSLTINGPKPKPGARILTVSAKGASRVFFIADDATAVINRLNISNGLATSPSAILEGGGIYNDGDSLTLTNSTVSGSKAAGGGGIYNDGPSSELTLRNSTVSGNTSDGSAGILNNGEMTLTNSTVSGNKATFSGGGIFNNGANSTMTLINSTVTNNTAGQGGGGINNNGGTAILRNTIVAGNTASSGPDAFGTFSSQGNNLIRNTSGAVGFGGSDILNRNPLLGPLQDNGGQTDTHALLSRSPAIDKGTNTGC
ncbi:MAG TPA: choice-of-anchor Q domain-containing protein, partial [Rubrobacter sp.]|nr:choice-of-anchor Q domain-containing protein [Rubrobacter sp.]